MRARKSDLAKVRILGADQKKSGLWERDWLPPFFLKRIVLTWIDIGVFRWRFTVCNCLLFLSVNWIYSEEVKINFKFIFMCLI